MRLACDQRKNLEDVQNLLIPTPKGTQIPLNQVADVTIKESVNQIQREDAKRRIIVGFNVGDRDVQSIVTDLQKQIDKKIKFPSGYFVTYGGAFDNLIAAKKRLSLAVPVSLLLIFFLLYFSFLIFIVSLGGSLCVLYQFLGVQRLDPLKQDEPELCN